MARLLGGREYGLRPNRRRRQVEAVVLSAAAHAGLVVALMLHAPSLRRPPPERGPPEAVIPVLILPRTPPQAAASGPRPSPIRLHQRALRSPDEEEETPVKPLIVPALPSAPPAPPAPTPKALPTAPPDPTTANATRALRGLIGCANPSLLTRDERERCERALAAGAGAAPFPGLGIGRGKEGDLARAAARKEANYRYKRGETTPAPGGNLPWDDQRSPPDGRANFGFGASSTDLGATPGKRKF